MCVCVCDYQTTHFLKTVLYKAKSNVLHLASLLVNTAKYMSKPQKQFCQDGVAWGYLQFIWRPSEFHCSTQVLDNDGGCMGSWQFTVCVFRLRHWKCCTWNPDDAQICFWIQRWEVILVKGAIIPDLPEVIFVLNTNTTLHQFWERYEGRLWCFMSCTHQLCSYLN